MSTPSQYIPITAAQSTAAQNSANADAQLATQQARQGALGGQYDINGDRGVARGSNLTAIGSPQFASTMNAVDPTGQGNFGQDLQETTNILQPESTADKILQTIALGASVGALTAGAGGMLAAPAAAAFGSTGGAIASGAGAGAVGGLAQGVLTQGTVSGKDIGMGALGGGIAGGASTLANGLGDTIYNADPGLVSSDTADAIAGGITKGAVGAGMGALRGGSNGALVGGIGGATAGAVTGGTGMQPLGQASGILASGLANKYLTSPTSAPAPATAPAAAPAAPATASTQQVLPILPGQTAVNQQPVSGPQGNIGQYSGYQGNTTGLGYAPRQEANMSNVNWATYGEGPEQQFFQPASGG